MPSLTWASKTTPQPIRAALELDSIIYPQGVGYSFPSSTNPPLPDQLISGDNLSVMSALLPEYEGRIHLIYADPPFFTNRRYPARVGRGEDSRQPRTWQLAEGYPDHWPDLDAYLDYLYPRLWLMHRLLAPTGTLYLHLDWHANACARLLLDEIFGPERLLNEIIWIYHGPSPIRRAFNRKHDTLLAYTKGKEYTFNADAVRQPYNPNTVKTFESSPKAGFGKVPDLARGKVPEDWWYFPVVARLHRERTGYPTQKPEALLERLIQASSNGGEIVADFFCGSGTTPLVAARLGRRFIASDVTFRAVHTTRCRLLELPAQPFRILRSRGVGEISTEGNNFTTSQPFDRPREESFNLPVFQPSTNNLTLTNPAPDLDYWEADPAWDGQVFRSVAQAARPRNNQPIGTTLSLPNVPANQPICVRLVSVNGLQTQLD